MRMQNIALEDIVWNPWRDKSLFPIDPDHVAALQHSIRDHGFFASLKGRRRNGKVEIGCGHSRLEAARKAKLDTIPIFIDDIDDDGMLRLMTDENTLQSGTNPGAVLNEVAAVTRRLIEVVSSDNCPEKITRLFNGVKGFKQTRTKLITGSDVHRTLGVDIIRGYLGDGDPDRAGRGEKAIREAISALKQSGRYDAIVEDELAKHPQPALGKPAAEGKQIMSGEEFRKLKKRERILDERTANVFTNDHQFHAFREAVTTPGAQRIIPVEQQLTLAKAIVKTHTKENALTTKKQIGAPYIKKMVQAKVEEGLKQQRNINKEEREAYVREQTEAQIDAELHSASASVRSLLSALSKLNDLARKYPSHPKIGGFAAKLDQLASAIKQFGAKIK